MKRLLSNEDKEYLKRTEELLFNEKPKTFIEFVNKKYNRLVKKAFRSKQFTTWDDYALWLYYVYCGKSISFYYSQLEDDLKAYSDIQTDGIEEAYDGYFYLKDKVPDKW